MAAAAVPSTSGAASSENRGIPEAVFIEDVPKYLAKLSLSAEGLLKQLHLLYGKYKFMEANLVQQKKQMLVKIPDIANAVEALKHLVRKKEANETLTTNFELSSALFVEARIKPQDTVMLWLGANVMLEYQFEEALQLLSTNHANALVTKASLDKELAFLKDQITVSEVNIARVHNHNVVLKRKAAAAQ